MDIEDDSEDSIQEIPQDSQSSCHKDKSKKVQPSTKKRRLSSGVWSHFSMLPRNSDGKLECKCNKCGAKYATDSKSGTGMWNIFKYLEPRVCHFSRNTIKSDIKKIYGVEFGRLRTELLACPSRICLTYDAWTFIATDGYPELAKLARDVLVVPVSTVASESAFSLGGRIIDQYRSSMSPQVVEALICSRDWLFGENYISLVKLEDVTQDIMTLDLNKGARVPVLDIGFVMKLCRVFDNGFATPSLMSVLMLDLSFGVDFVMNWVLMKF
ncbi:hypothetical protein ZIOFF_025542 [Zingiber officinale]|uniref:HAT C-terminal dimerisation domain-containing protein n=1 Tax=Zingiber officinale TaxID=94328 RepID=A0A8J5GXZ2_ZINOF|nr:hypothetical protein ZIOFF_025542 [Zingiber officinale]